MQGDNQKQIEDLTKVLNTWQRRRSFLKNGLAVANSQQEKFSLQESIDECEQEIEKVTDEINSLKPKNIPNKKPKPNSVKLDNDRDTSTRDVFICHASEDKQEVVEPIVNALEGTDISYWYDKAEIKWGDSITQKVNDGLKISRFVMVVLSSDFLNKKWAQRELNAILNIQASSGEVKILLLIVGNDSRERESILSQFPLLNDLLYLTWNGSTQEIIEALQSRLSDPK